MTLTTREAIAQIVPLLGRSPAVCATGFIAREVQAACDRPENFYVIGSMGMCSSIGLGIALARPDQKVFVIDGDGSVLMNLGNLALVGALKPKNFIHIVLDNEAYASTGNQKTISSAVRLDDVARAAGYTIVTSLEELSNPGPLFLLLKVGPDTYKAAPRVQAEPDEITRRFMASIT